MKIRNCIGVACLAIGFLLASGITALASSGSLVLNQDVVVHGTTLPAGKYNIRWKTHSPEATVEFSKRQGVVLSTEGRYEDRRQVYSRDMYVTEQGPDGTRKLVEVRFAGSSKVLTFN